MENGKVLMPKGKDEMQNGKLKVSNGKLKDKMENENAKKPQKPNPPKTKQYITILI